MNTILFDPLTAYSILFLFSHHDQNLSDTEMRDALSLESSTAYLA